MVQRKSKFDACFFKFYILFAYLSIFYLTYLKADIIIYLGYQPELKDTATLQLNDLKKPGNYTFKLTVTDTDKATSSSTANITVLKFTDYPPDANAG